MKDDILQEIPRIILRIQNNVLKTRRAKDNSLCKIKCGSGPLIHNFTDVKIPQQLTDMLKSGLKFVPHSQCHVDEILSDLDKEAKLVCKNIFYSSYGHYPHVSPGFSLSSSVLQIIAQCVTNSSTISSLINFRDQFLENIPFFINSLPIDGLNVKKMVNLIPQGCIISASDKNIGVSILPPSWYSKEYHSQILKGGHELVDISESRCLALLNGKITNFKKNCSKNQEKILRGFWPRKSVSIPRIGVMKLVPKVHKLDGPIDNDSWKDLKSRPIRGAENDPVKDPSKALYGLLQLMLSKFKMKFPALDNDQKENFTVLKGCDDYLGRVSLIQLDSKLFLQTCLISSDFSDAYTETGVERLKSSVRSVGDLIGYEHDHVDLIEKLIDLVFLNCYLYTPYRQTKGMPMGDYISRDALDLDLTKSEFEIMNCFHTLSF